MKRKRRTAVEHGIDGAVYSWNGCLAMAPDGSTVQAYDPTLFCLCGFTASGIDWAEAGAEFDEHLAEDVNPARAARKERP